MKLARLALLVAFAVAASPLSALENEIARRDHLQRLRGALRVFERINGGVAPVRLSQLVDESLVSGPEALMRPGSPMIPVRAELDTRSDYTLDTLPGVADLMVRERTPLAGENEVLAIFKDGTLKALPLRASVARAAATPPPPNPKATAPASGTKTAAADGGASKRMSDWLAGRPVTLPGKSAPIKPLFGGASAPAEHASRAATVTATTPPPAPPPAPPAASGSAGELAATMLAFVNALKQPNAQPGAQPTPQQLSELQARVDAYIEQEARAGRYGTSAQLINLLMELERLLRSRAQSPAAVATSSSFTPPPTDVSATAAVLDAIAKANAASATPAAPSIQATPGPNLPPGPGPTSAPNPPASASGAGFRQLVYGQPAPDITTATSEISDYNYGQAKAAGDFRRMVKIDMSRGRLVRKNAGIGSETNNEEKFYESALFCQRKLGLGNVPEVASTLNDIGVVYTESRTYGAAEGNFKQAQQIWETLAPTDAASRGDYAVMLQNFSVLREKQGDTAEAARLKAMAEGIRAGRR